MGGSPGYPLGDPRFLFTNQIGSLYDATTETKRRKKLDPNRIAPWELRIDHYRIFYDSENTAVIKVVAIGYKDHNDLYIRGKKVEL